MDLQLLASTVSSCYNLKWKRIPPFVSDPFLPRACPPHVRGIYSHLVLLIPDIPGKHFVRCIFSMIYDSD